MCDETIITHYILSGVVSAVEERFETLGARKGANDQTEFVQRSIGWFVQFEGGASIYLGHEKPTFVRGDRVRLTLERV